MPSKARDRGTAAVRGGMELSKGSQNDRLVRTLVLEVRNNIRYQKEAMRLARQALQAFESLKGEEGGDKPDSAAKKRRRELHEQTIKDRETERKDRSRERNLFMNLTALVVISSVFFGGLTAIFVVLTAKYSQPWGYAGSVIGLTLTLITSLAGPRGMRMLFSLVPAEWVDRSEEAPLEDAPAP